jgi:hypothetical protein
MLNLIFAQLKSMGFDPDVARDQIAKAVGDIRAMKESQDRTEAMVKFLYDQRTPDRTEAIVKFLYDHRTPEQIAAAIDLVARS